ncbi:hypothetical protein Pelo_19933 [Pelomyxa schiedti]|nr:hypothetical protein Pelo_19933 [Pelomyxa schiedti]
MAITTNLNTIPEDWTCADNVGLFFNRCSDPQESGVEAQSSSKNCRSNRFYSQTFYYSSKERGQGQGHWEGEGEREREREQDRKNSYQDQSQNT